MSSCNLLGGALVFFLLLGGTRAEKGWEPLFLNTVNVECQILYSIESVNCIFGVSTLSTLVFFLLLECIVSYQTDILVRLLYLLCHNFATGNIVMFVDNYFA